MNTRAYYSQRFAAEKAAFLRVFRALPADRLDYKPHERSMSAAQLVWLLTSELDDACKVAATGEVDFKQTPPLATLDAMVEHYEKNAAELERLLASVDDAAWEKPARFKMDGNVVWETGLGDMMWGFLFDAIHHRGQLSTYLRPMGGKVPSIYGPSADDPGM